MREISPFPSKVVSISSEINHWRLRMRYKTNQKLPKIVQSELDIPLSIDGTPDCSGGDLFSPQVFVLFCFFSLVQDVWPIAIVNWWHTHTHAAHVAMRAGNPKLLKQMPIYYILHPCVLLIPTARAREADFEMSIYCIYERHSLSFSGISVFQRRLCNAGLSELWTGDVFC